MNMDMGHLYSDDMVETDTPPQTCRNGIGVSTGWDSKQDEHGRHDGTSCVRVINLWIDLAVND